MQVDIVRKNRQTEVKTLPHATAVSIDNDYSQSLIEADFAGQWLWDPVNERLWFISLDCLTAGHLQLRHNTSLVLKYFQQQ